MKSHPARKQIKRGWETPKVAAARIRKFVAYYQSKQRQDYEVMRHQEGDWLFVPNAAEYATSN